MAQKDSLIAWNAYEGSTPKNPYLWSSHNWMVWQAGHLMKKQGFEAPTKASVRGYKVTIKVYSETYVFNFKTEDEPKAA